MPTSPSAVADDVGALVGEVVAGAGSERWSAATAPRAGSSPSRPTWTTPTVPGRPPPTCSSAERRSTPIGGFYEGVRAAEDTDFSWRLQQAGWRLELRAGRTSSTATARRRRPAASVARLRGGPRVACAPLRGLPARAGCCSGPRRLRRANGRRPPRMRPPAVPGAGRAAPGAGRAERAVYAALDGLLSVEELAGFALSNRPADRGRGLRPRPPSCSSPIASPRRAIHWWSSRRRSSGSGSRRSEDRTRSIGARARAAGRLRRGRRSGAPPDGHSRSGRTPPAQIRARRARAPRRAAAAPGARSGGSANRARPWRTDPPARRRPERCRRAAAGRLSGRGIDR